MKNRIPSQVWIHITLYN